jgi:multiple sugar transport system permease protein
MTEWQRARGRSAKWFLLPAMTLLTVFVVWPLLRAGWWSFTNADLLSPERAHGVWLENYGDLWADGRFRSAFANTWIFALLVVPVQTVAAFFLALWVNRPEPAWRMLRGVFFVPVVVAMPVLAVLWTLLYQPAQGGDMGPVNAALGVFGMPPQAWLREPALALPAIAFMSIWQGTGLQMMVFLAGLQNVPKELLEAAKIDGASAWQRVWHVVVPAMRNTIIFVVTVTTILAFRIFVQPYLMTRGGPGNSTLSLIQSVYEMTFVSQNLGRACAAAMTFLVLVGGLTALQRVLLKEERE